MVLFDRANIMARFWIQLW